MLAAALGLAVGVVTGGLGGGGGVLTVPALAYVLGQSAQDATAGSVVIVGITAVVGVLVRVHSGFVRWRTGLAFGAVGIPSAALGTLVNQRVAEPVLLLSFAALTVRGGGLGPRLAPGPVEPGATVPAGSRGGVAIAAPPAVASPVDLALKIVVCGAAIGFLTGFLAGS